MKQPARRTQRRLATAVLGGTRRQRENAIWKTARQEAVTWGRPIFGEKVLARQISTEAMNRMNSRYDFGIWLARRSNSAECFIGNADGVFRARGIRIMEPQIRWDKEATTSVIGVPWRLTDGRWTAERLGVCVDPIPIPPLPYVCRSTSSEGKNFKARQ